MSDDLSPVGWRSVLALATAAILAGIGVCAVFVQLYATQPAVADPWATAPDLEPVEPRANRLLWVVVDAMNADMAFDERVMPFVASLTPRGAFGIGRTAELTLTGPAVWTLGTGRWPTLLHAVENFDPPPAGCDNLFRRFVDGGLSVYTAGDAAWARRYRPWVARSVELHDRGHHDVRDSDDKALAAAFEWLGQERPPDVLIVHLVGADHVGHPHGTVGVDGPYARRLREIDQDIGRLAAAAGPGTPVLVMADHGMTDAGGHGGGEEKPRSAPFVWVGPGVKVGGPLDLPQTVFAPTLAAYYGLPAPAEAEDVPSAALLDISDAEASALVRNTIRQRVAVTGDPSGKLAAIPLPARIGAWGVVLLIGLCMVLLAVGVLTRPLRRPAWLLALPLLSLAAVPVLPPLPVALTCAAGMVVLLWACPLPGTSGRPVPDVVASSPAGEGRRVLVVAVATVLAALPLSTLPLLRWWKWHVLLYGLLVLGLAAAAAVHFWRGRRRAEAATALAAGLLTLALLVGTHLGLDVRTIPDAIWGVPLLVAAAVGSVAAGGGRPAMVLGAAALLYRFLPLEILANGMLLALLPLSAVIARRSLLSAAWGLVVATSVLFDAAQLGVMVLLGSLVSVMSRLPVPRTTGLWVALVPVVVTLLEAASYLMLGKEYTFSSVQVALAFVGSEELDLVHAVTMVALGDLVPWAVIVIATLAWARRGGGGLAPLVMAAAIAPLPLRLLVQVAIFPQVGASFWFASSIVPFMAATMILVLGLLPVLGIAVAGAGRKAAAEA